MVRVSYNKLRGSCPRKGAKVRGILINRGFFLVPPDDIRVSRVRWPWVLGVRPVVCFVLRNWERVR